MTSRFNPTGTPVTSATFRDSFKGFAKDDCQTGTSSLGRGYNQDERINGLQHEVWENQKSVTTLVAKVQAEPSVFVMPLTMLMVPYPQPELKRKPHRRKKRKRTKQSTKWCYDCKAAHVGQCSIQTRRCTRCGEIGHVVQGCLFARDVCWNCRMEGHRSGQCPYVKRSDIVAGSELEVEWIGESSANVGSVGGSSAIGRKRKNPFLLEGRALQMPVDLTTDTDDATTGTFLIN